MMTMPNHRDYLRRRLEALAKYLELPEAGRRDASILLPFDLRRPGAELMQQIVALRTRYVRLQNPFDVEPGIGVPVVFSHCRPPR